MCGVNGMEAMITLDKGDDQTGDRRRRPAGARVVPSLLHNGWACLFWAVFALSIVLHKVIGGVVVDTRIQAGLPQFLLRNGSGQWEDTSWILFSIEKSKHLRLVLGLICVGWAFWALTRSSAND